MADLRQFSALQSIGAFRTGQADRRARDERSLLQDVGKLQSSGRLGEARGRALEGGNFQLATSIQGEIDRDQGRFLADSARAAIAGDTPEKFEAGKAELIRQHPRHEADIISETFEQRENIINAGRQLEDILRSRAGPKLTQRDKDFADLVSRGFSENDARDIAAGRIRARENPITGLPETLNLATGETRAAGAAPAATTTPQPSAVPEAQAGPTLTKKERQAILDDNAEINRAKSLLSDLDPAIRSGTGPGASVAELVDKFAGFVGTRAFADTVENRNKVRILAKELQKALVNNPRFPVAEQALVQRLLPNADAFFVNPGAEVDKLRSLAQFLDAREQANTAQLSGISAPPAQFGESVRQRTATNPQTGEKVRFNEQTGEWEPL